MASERGQGTVEWVALLALVSLLFTGLVALGVAIPGAPLARLLADRILCAASLADGCGDEPVLIASYGDEVGRLVRRHMPNLVFERGSKALPVDWRRCRRTACGDQRGRKLVHRTDAGLPVTAFVHVVDCRPDTVEETEVDGGRCDGDRRGYLYVQYWTYYADSATYRGIPIAEDAGYHHDDWEGVQIRVAPDGSVEERASSHHGYDYDGGAPDAGSEADIEILKSAAETLGARPANGWGPETHFLFVAGGSHAGNAAPSFDGGRITPGRRVHLIPLEPIAAEDDSRFAITAPWRKQVWTDPEASDTD